MFLGKLLEHLGLLLAREDADVPGLLAAFRGLGAVATGLARRSLPPPAPDPYIAQHRIAALFFRFRGGQDEREFGVAREAEPQNSTQPPDRSTSDIA